MITRRRAMKAANGPEGGRTRGSFPRGSGGRSGRAASSSPPAANGQEGGRARGSFPRRSGRLGGRAASSSPPRTLLEIVNQQVVLGPLDAETYGCYVMKKKGKKSYYFGKVNDDGHRPCRSWTRTSQGYYTSHSRPGIWNYLGQWEYTSTRPGSFAAERSAKWAAAWRVAVCKAGREAFPDYEYPTCANILKRRKALSQLSEKRRRQRLLRHLAQKRNPVTMWISCSPSVSPADVSCRWIPHKRVDRTPETVQLEVNALAASSNRGISRTPIYKKAWRMKLNLPKKKPGPRPDIAEDLAKAVGYYAQMNIAEAASKGGVSGATLYYELKRLNVPIRNKKEAAILRKSNLLNLNHS